MMDREDLIQEILGLLNGRTATEGKDILCKALGFFFWGSVQFDGAKEEDLIREMSGGIIDEYLTLRRMYDRLKLQSMGVKAKGGD